LLAVTVLTSLDDAALAEVMGRGAGTEEAVGRLAALASGSGIDGAVASVAECRAVKAVCGADFLVATPGIRLAGGDAHDQKRVAAPGEARAAGADYLVVGRAITAADDPGAALRRVMEEAGATG
nr:orotidine 5'-phosphate decarboxylase / HUMPS family protein [Candidatus Palauibacterales bacterium]